MLIARVQFAYRSRWSYSRGAHESRSNAVLSRRLQEPFRNPVRCEFVWSPSRLAAAPQLSRSRSLPNLDRDGHYIRFTAAHCGPFAIEYVKTNKLFYFLFKKHLSPRRRRLMTRVEYPRPNIFAMHDSDFLLSRGGREGPFGLGYAQYVCRIDPTWDRGLF